MKSLVNGLVFCLVLLVTSSSILAQSMPSPVWTWGTKNNTKNILLDEEEETQGELSAGYAAKSNYNSALEGIASLIEEISDLQVPTEYQDELDDLLAEYADIVADAQIWVTALDAAGTLASDGHAEYDNFLASGSPAWKAWADSTMNIYVKAGSDAGVAEAGFNGLIDRINALSVNIACFLESLP